MTPIFFPSPGDFRRWLFENHGTETELLVGYYKVESGKPSMTWSQSVDEALCYGWIDGVRRSAGPDSYCIRFTPRKPGSNWSAINIRKVEELSAKGLMQPAGLVAFAARKDEKSGVYSFENDTKQLSADLESRFMANKTAWDFFTSQPPSYKKTIIYWIMSAKQEATRLSRLEKTIAESENQKRLWDRYRL